MKLTPLDIKKQEFKRIMRGFDTLEVETFLEMVANEYEALLNEKDQLKSEALILRTQVKDYQQVEQTLKETLMNAQESISRTRVNTEKEAGLIIHEAELRAEKILDQARNKVEKIKNDITLLRVQKESFINRLRHLLESQIELIKVLQIDDSELKDERKQSKRKKAIPLPVIQEELPLTSDTRLHQPEPVPTEQSSVESPAENPSTEPHDDDQMVF